MAGAPICEVKARKLCLQVQGFATIMLMILFFFVITSHGALNAVKERDIIKEASFSNTAKSRKLMTLPEEADVDDDDGYVERMGATCSKDNILVFQGQTSPLPNGIPTYTVDIQNACSFGSCSIFDIHLSCGWFSSARLINPNVFRRIGYDDCLVNDGAPMNPGDSLSFQYANTYQYPLEVSSGSCA